MTVETEDSFGNPIVISGPYVGNGVVAVLDYNFPVQLATELEVVRQNTATKLETVLELNVDYTVSGVGSSTGGQITIINPAVRFPTGTQIVIRYDGSFRQPVDYSNQGAIQLAVLEASLDRITMTLRQLFEAVRRGVAISSFSNVDLMALQSSINALGPIASQISTLAPQSAQITTIATNIADVTTLAAALNAGASPFTSPVTISGAAPALSLIESDAATGWNRIRFHRDAGAYRTQLRSSTDVAVQDLSVVNIDASGAVSHVDRIGAADRQTLNAGGLLTGGDTNHRFQIAGTDRITVDSTGLIVNGLASATRMLHNTPTRIGTGETTTDCNNITLGGSYHILSTAANLPEAGFNFSLVHIPSTDTTAAAQIAIRQETGGPLGSIWMRSRAASVWSAWGRGAAGTSTVSEALPTAATYDFTGIPAWATRILVTMSAVEFTVNTRIRFRLRQPTGGLVTTDSYRVFSTRLGSTSLATLAPGAGFGDLFDPDALTGINGHMSLTRTLSGSDTVWAVSTLFMRAPPSSIAGFIGGGLFMATEPSLNGYQLSPASGTFVGGAGRTVATSWST